MQTEAPAGGRAITVLEGAQKAQGVFRAKAGSRCDRVLARRKGAAFSRKRAWSGRKGERTRGRGRRQEAHRIFRRGLRDPIRPFLVSIVDAGVRGGTGCRANAYGVCAQGPISRVLPVLRRFQSGQASLRAKFYIGRPTAAMRDNKAKAWPVRGAGWLRQDGPG